MASVIVTSRQGIFDSNCIKDLTPKEVLEFSDEGLEEYIHHVSRNQTCYQTKILDQAGSHDYRDFIETLCNTKEVRESPLLIKTLIHLLKYNNFHIHDLTGLLKSGVSANEKINNVITRIYEAVFARLSDNAKTLLLFLLNFGARMAMTQDKISEAMRGCGIGSLKNKDGQAANLEDVLQELTDSLALYTNEDGYVYKIKRLTYRTLLFEDFKDEDTFSFKKKREELVFPLWLLQEMCSYNMPKYKMEATLNLMKERNIDINAYDVSGRTILHRAIISYWDMEKINFLLDNGANVNAQDFYGFTPLDLAVPNSSLIPYYGDHKELLEKNIIIIELLLSRGAKCISFCGRYPFYIKEDRTVMMSIWGGFKKIFFLFDKYGFGLEKENSAVISLSFLARNENKSVVENEKFYFLPAEVNGRPVVGITSKKYRPSSDKHIDIQADVETILLPSTLKYICSGSGLPVFYNASNIKRLTLPPGLLSIGEFAFRGSSIEEIKIPDSVIYIGTSAFMCSVLLKSIELPSGIRLISCCTFLGCTNLKKVVIHGNIVSIDYEAFGYCCNLETVQIAAIVPPRLGHDVFRPTNPRLNIYVPDAAVEDYRHAKDWSEYADRILPVSQIPQEQ
jgi:hypothetical protein